MAKKKKAPVRSFRAVDGFAGKEDFPVESPEDGALHAQFSYLGVVRPMPSEREIAEVLGKMGKTTPTQPSARLK